MAANPITSSAYDPGLTQTYSGELTRAINADGSFNVKRIGVGFHDFHPYLYLINASWVRFAAILVSTYILVNLLFAAIYMVTGIGNLKGINIGSIESEYLNAFFFSAHTLTTVGYGNIYPAGIIANTVAATEALFGLMMFAIATGVMYGRFAKPTARIGYSKSMVVAPFAGGMSLQFRIVNRRSNNLIGLEAQVMLMTVEPVEGRLQRKYALLPLERDRVVFFPLTWTIVHPIDENSPLSGKVPEDLKRLQAEILIMIKATDDTFGQGVQSRNSYRYDEITWNARFTPAFEIDEQGEMRVEVNRVSDLRVLEPAEVRAASAIAGAPK